ncbi:hypothetical protein, partial [Desulfococcus multivorans]
MDSSRPNDFPARVGKLNIRIRGILSCLKNFKVFPVLPLSLSVPWSLHVLFFFGPLTGRTGEKNGLAVVCRLSGGLAHQFTTAVLRHREGIRTVDNTPITEVI